MTPGQPVRSAAVVALKPIDQAKSRLGTMAFPLRRQLAWSMALDTLTALSAAVDEVLVVSPDASLPAQLDRAGLAVSVVGEPPGAGMNGALSSGAELLRAHGCGLVLACVADLPALRPESVRRVLRAAQSRPRSFLADASGVGTTMLVAADTALDPRFQGASAAAHRLSGATALTDDVLGAAVPDARHDVDTEADLGAAQALGLGPATTALLGPPAVRSQPAGSTLAGNVLGRKLGR
jgi:2-phospho-L-lactate guanylyltransferase